MDALPDRDVSAALEDLLIQSRARASKQRAARMEAAFDAGVLCMLASTFEASGNFNSHLNPKA
jgi:hypothetical protein